MNPYLQDILNDRRMETVRDLVREHTDLPQEVEETVADLVEQVADAESANMAADDYTHAEYTSFVFGAIVGMERLAQELGE